MDVFGVWLVPPGAANVAHYFLPGQARCLCGRRAGHPDAKPPERALVPHMGKYTMRAHLLTPYCPECKALNEERWLGMYHTQEGEAC